MTVSESLTKVVTLGRAAGVLCRRGMITPWRPWEAIRASRAVRRYGAFGGLADFTAVRYGDRQALADITKQLTFREFDAQSSARARVLATATGEPAVVGLLRRSGVDFLLDLAAANKAGARSVLLNTGFAGPQLGDVCRREGVSVVVADDEFSALLVELETDVECLIGSRMADLAAEQSGSGPPAPARAGGLVLLTSGTTGTPKGAPRDRISPLQSAQLLDRIPWPRNSVYYVAAPLFHATGLATCTLGLALGNRVVLSRRFDARETLAAVQAHRVEALVLVPTMLSRIVDLPRDVLDSVDASSLKVIFVAGSSLSPALCRRAAEQFGDVLYNLYGSTEVATAAVAIPAELKRAPGTVGRPPVGCVVVAYDSEDRRITRAGEVGTLYVSSGLSFAGYTNGGHKKTLDGLLSSGDTGHFDEEGLWFIDGRDDDMVVSGGENVFPLEIENLLAELPGVREAAVVGVPDSDFGMCLRAFVVAHTDHTLDADHIRDAVRSRLARHKVPRDVVFVKALPRNETGKVVKNRLAEMGQS